MTGRKALASREEMLADTEKDMEARWSRGLSKRKAHSFGEGWQEKYYEDLAITADVEPIKPYVTKMYIENRLNQRKDLATFRRYKFTIIDDENYETTLLP
jgi:dimethylaniline monooxygenase (N-oxide forming)